MLLKKIETLVEMHDKFLIMNRMTLEEFCMAEDIGLISVLIALYDNADDFDLDHEARDIIQAMLEIVPSKLSQLKRLSPSSTQKHNIERETKELIRGFIRKPCREYLKTFGVSQAGTISEPAQSKIRGPAFEEKELENQREFYAKDRAYVYPSANEVHGVKVGRIGDYSPPTHEQILERYPDATFPKRIPIGESGLLRVIVRARSPTKLCSKDCPC